MHAATRITSIRYFILYFYDGEVLIPCVRLLCSHSKPWRFDGWLHRRVKWCRWAGWRGFKLFSRSWKWCVHVNWNMHYFLQCCSDHHVKPIVVMLPTVYIKLSPSTSLRFLIFPRTRPFDMAFCVENKFIPLFCLTNSLKSAETFKSIPLTCF